MKREMPQIGGLVLGDVVLDDTCLFAHRNGEQIRFTRSERALLLVLSRNPHRLMQRSQLLDAIAPTQAEASDRNVDFLVNRLRTKLGDSARAPRFIATQYGEGYVWIATSMPAVAPRPEPAPASGLLAITALVSPHDKRLAERADIVTGQMRDMIAARLGAGEAVIVLGHEEGAATQATRYVLKVSFQDNGGRLDCTATLRQGPSRRIIRAFRLEFGDATMASLVPEVERVSIGIIEALLLDVSVRAELGTAMTLGAGVLRSAASLDGAARALQAQEVPVPRRR